nr:hypothetical protein [Tanacetum cinerariifolium]
GTYGAGQRAGTERGPAATALRAISAPTHPRGGYGRGPLYGQAHGRKCRGRHHGAEPGRGRDNLHRHFS